MNFKFEIGQKKESGLIFKLAERLLSNSVKDLASQSQFLSLLIIVKQALAPNPKVQLTLGLKIESNSILILFST